MPRCAVHPALPAVDLCPVCERPRCAADSAAAPGGGCLACEGRRAPAGPPPLDLRALVGAAVCCGLVAVPLGLIASEYVGAGAIGYVAPGLVGIVVSIAAEAGARHRRGPALRLLAVAYTLIGVGYSLRSNRAAASPFSPAGKVLVLYAIGALGSWLWTEPPRRVARKDPDEVL